MSEHKRNPARRTIGRDFRAFIELASIAEPEFSHIKGQNPRFYFYRKFFPAKWWSFTFRIAFRAAVKYNG